MEVVAVHGGFVEVRDNRVTVLSDVAELSADIDVERARRAKESAEGRGSGGGDSGDDQADSEAALRRANTRLAAAERGGH